MTCNVVAFDLGASSGRAIRGSFDGEALTLKEARRFENHAIRLNDRLTWNAPGLYENLVEGLSAVLQDGGMDSIGMDTWGVDFALLDGQDQLIGNPVCYRDARTEGMMDKAFAVMPKQEIAQRTGLAFLQFNTLYQLHAMRLAGDPQLEIAKTLLPLPDFLAWLFCGEKGAEYTHASTTQLTDPRTRDWSPEILSAFQLPQSWFQPMQSPGTVRGTLRDSLRKELRAGSVPVVAVGSHDTASAVAAVPAEGNFAYISSGTWSLVGLETRQPVINPLQLKYNLTNEGGVFDTTRVLRNVMGLWIIQECRRAWQQEGKEYSFAQLCALAEKEPAFTAIIDPDDGDFLYPDDMPAKVRAYCQKTGQPAPETPERIARVVFESLAIRYAITIDQLKQASGQPVDALYIVGGGSNNQLLNQFTANATGLPIYAGPGEATAIGNCLLQLYALGRVGGLSQMRAIVRRSFPPMEVRPRDMAMWADMRKKALQSGWISD